MAKHKLTIAERVKGARKLVRNPKVGAGLKKWAKQFLAKYDR